MNIHKFGCYALIAVTAMLHGCGGSNDATINDESISVLPSGPSVPSVPAAPASAPDFVYIAVELASPFVRSVNAVGQVAGDFYVSPGNLQSFITGPNGEGKFDLEVPIFGGSTNTLGINSTGQVTGVMTGIGSAFTTGPNGADVILLGTLGGSYSQGAAINDAGVVVGWSYTAGSANQHAFITGPNGAGMIDITALATTPTEDLGGYATAVNSTGQVTGTMVYRSLFIGRAFITEPNGLGMRDIGSIGGGNSYGEGINSSGQVVGTTCGNFGINNTLGSSVNYGNAFCFAFITGPNGTGMRILDGLGGTISRASGINSIGQVVGTSSLESEVIQHAFVTGPDGTGVVDLNSLVTAPGGGYFSEALAINDSGQIVAISAGNGQLRAYLISRVPRP